MDRLICVQIPVFFFVPILDLPFELLLILNFKLFNAEIVIFPRENVNFCGKLCKIIAFFTSKFY